MSTTISSFLGLIEQQVINPLVELLVFVAFVIFLWGVFDYIRNSANEEKRAQGVQHIVWGLIGMVIMFGALAIIHIMSNVVNIFGTTTNTSV